MSTLLIKQNDSEPKKVEQYCCKIVKFLNYFCSDPNLSIKLLECVTSERSRWCLSPGAGPGGSRGACDTGSWAGRVAVSQSPMDGADGEKQLPAC